MVYDPKKKLPAAGPASILFFFCKNCPQSCPVYVPPVSQEQGEEGRKEKRRKKKSFARVSLRCRENEEEKRRKEIMLLQAASAFLHKAMSLTGRKKG
jgi:cytochrome oxidase Cu insertion factor (SCO1/SenC/PrrC family)